MNNIDIWDYVLRNSGYTFQDERCGMSNHNCLVYFKEALIKGTKIIEETQQLKIYFNRNTEIISSIHCNNDFNQSEFMEKNKDKFRQAKLKFLLNEKT